ncbi:TRAP transporter substrate-binding protein [Notoacmeibacter sp. MSK16QG-6]|uniref:TRAP transporter substrate-binding protein n=1 Tax=Notoacmeibacter sp. MSK16QG-6 TaxID=2957982 RepID=UPI00209FB5AF|nr:TRAP transporter substrate-binding protein [Notoacmeibacter sp. MSK16QG-6]MCP1199522.1 TRAP transporter substrate-binding protein [Notoacmeibacter sp. MSK16QG-6]
MQRRQFLAGAAAGALAMPGLMRTAWAQEPEITLKLHHFLGPKAPAHTKMFTPWAETIAEKSGGRVKIEIYPSMTLGGAPPQLFRQVADGVVDIVWTVNGYTPGLFPRSEAFELPGVYVNDITATNLAMRQLFDEWLAPEYEPVHVLFNHVHAGQAFHMAEEPVRTVADTQGKKLRVPGPTGNAVVEAMGATPVTMPVPDLPQALSTSGVDGALIPWEIIPPLQLQEVTKYQIEGPDNKRFGTTTFQVSMNKNRWESLPEDLQQVFNEASNEDWLREIGEVWRAADDHGIEVATKAGNEHIVLTEEEMKTFDDALAPVVDKWIEEHSGDFDAAGLVEAARKAIADNS